MKSSFLKFFRNRISITSAATDAALSCLILFLDLRLLALTPQSGDGAELVQISHRGGVAHPPGFPLQAWLQKLFILLPFHSYAWRISLLSAFAHVLAFLAIRSCGAALRLTPLASRLAGAFFVFAPSVWALGVQPEVFSLAYCLMAWTLWACLRETPSLEWKALSLGLLTGLSAAQHPISILLVPVFFYVFLQKKNLKTKAISIFLLSSFFTLILFYGSLPALRTGSLWPDWGRLQSFSDVWRHVLREEYGVFHLSSHRGDAAFLGLGLLPQELIIGWGLGCAFLLLGLIALRKKISDLLPVLLLLLSSLIFLCRTSVNELNFHSEAVLVRFMGTALIPLSLLAGLGLHSLQSKFSIGKLKYFPAVSACICIAFIILGNIRSVDFSKDRTLEIYREAIGESILPKTLVIASTDIDVFYGYQKESHDWFTVSSGLLNLPWYRHQTLPQQFPGINPPSHPGDSDYADLIRAIHRAGIRTAATDRRLLTLGESFPELHGILYITGPETQPGVTARSVQSVAKLCVYINQLDALPIYGKPLNRALYSFFAEAFASVSNFEKENKNTHSASFFSDVATELYRGKDPEKWRAACEKINTVLSP